MVTPKNLLQQQFRTLNNDVGQPPDDVERISYGIITEVDLETSQVKVNFLKDDKTQGEPVSKDFLPLINSLNQVSSLFGGLRKGLLVRIYWRGKLRPKTALIEIIGDEDSSFLKKDFETNEIETGPWFFLSGGLTG